MSDYCPDKWVVLKIEPKDAPAWYRLFGGWYGGYLGGDSWRMNSGITKIAELDTHYAVYGESGSIYKCNKGLEGLSGYMDSILYNFQQNALEKNAVISVCNIDEAMETITK